MSAPKNFDLKLPIRAKAQKPKRPVVDLGGQRFEMLVVEEHVADTVVKRCRLWRCACDCGGSIVSTTGNLRAGRTRSCGCFKRLEKIYAARRKQGDETGTPKCTCDGVTRKSSQSRLCGPCWRRWTNYRLTPEQYLAKLEFQAGLCGICTQPMKPGNTTCIDHCHATGAVRMILCNTCNCMLGHAKDDTRILSDSISYLNNFNGAKVA